MRRRKRRNLVKRIIRNCIFLTLLIVICEFALDLFPEKANLDKGWNLILVNSSHQIPEGYTPELKEISDGKLVDKRIYEPLIEMMKAGAAAGFHMVVVEAYRTEDEQQTLMEQKVHSYVSEGYPKFIAKGIAKNWVAVPGTSEHQLGIAVDINPDYEKSGREVYEWLSINAHEYGFICRYPEDKVKITGIQNEPWHYRYVGESAAKEMYEQGLCLEEYLEE